MIRTTSHIVSLFVLALLSVAALQGQASTPPDSLPFICHEANVVQYFSRSAAAPFYDRMADENTRRIVIAHFGDSHVQPDYSTAVLREWLQRSKGSGGRGMIFPYAIANTYSQFDYSSSYTGSWRSGNSIQTPPRVPVGICGFAAETDDSLASFTFRFKRPLEKGAKRIKVYCNHRSNGYILSLDTRGKTIPWTPDFHAPDTLPYIVLNAEEIGDTLEFKIRRTFGKSSFALYGVMIEQEEPGLLYLDLGVGGANFTAILYHTYFEGQISELKPDLVVLDWGTNDIVATNSIPFTMESTIRKVIAKVRAASPSTCILLTSVQDMRFRKRNITAAASFSDLVEKIAREEQCLFYDWYRVSGGKGAMKPWVANGLGGSDNLHLTPEGYRLKGRLLAEALQRSMNYYGMTSNGVLTTKELPGCTYSVPATPEKKSQPDTADKQVAAAGKKPKGGYKNYVVRSGDCLGVIAERYHTTIRELKRINGLKSDAIRAGQTIKVPSR